MSRITEDDAALPWLDLLLFLVLEWHSDARWGGPESSVGMKKLHGYRQAYRLPVHCFSSEERFSHPSGLDSLMSHGTSWAIFGALSHGLLYSTAPLSVQGSSPLSYLWLSFWSQNQSQVQHLLSAKQSVTLTQSLLALKNFSFFLSSLMSFFLSYIHCFQILLSPPPLSQGACVPTISPPVWQRCGKTPIPSLPLPTPQPLWNVQNWEVLVNIHLSVLISWFFYVFTCFIHVHSKCPH